MKKFNLSQIIKTAHNLCKNCPAKYTTFSAALKQSWKMAKFNVWMNEQCSILDAEEVAQEAAKQARRKAAAKEHAINEARRQAQRNADEVKAKAQRMREEIAARKEGITHPLYWSLNKKCSTISTIQAKRKSLTTLL